MDNSSVASVMDTTRITSFDLTTLNIDPGVYYIWVSGSVGDMVSYTDGYVSTCLLL